MSPAGIHVVYKGDCSMKNTTLLILLLVLISAIFIVGCIQQQPVQPTPQPTAIPADTIMTTVSSLGTILVDGQGKTLYYFANDIPANGTSSCYGQCAVAWPIFLADPIKVSTSLDPADFGSITRTDGTKQTTYYGWPLYYWQADMKPGDVSGENVQKVWFVMKPDERVLIANSRELGLYLTDTTGKTLYYFTKDTPGTSTCIGTCLATWPAFSTNPVTAPSVLKSSDFSALIRADGREQTAYMGRPLYYYADDAKPGDVKGQGFGNTWYVANISGFVPVATPTTFHTLSPSGGGYGGGGY
jgi:predicted lipoprotein with Yx(FWY)xxD motif